MLYFCGHYKYIQIMKWNWFWRYMALYGVIWRLKESASHEERRACWKELPNRFVRLPTFFFSLSISCVPPPPPAASLVVVLFSPLRFDFILFLLVSHQALRLEPIKHLNKSDFSLLSKIDRPKYRFYVRWLSERCFFLFGLQKKTTSPKQMHWI